MHIDIQTNFDFGIKTAHKGIGSDYDDISDEYFASIAAKNWLKFNFSFFNTFIFSYIWELTWFEFRPINFYFFTQQWETFEDIKDYIH